MAEISASTIRGIRFAETANDKLFMRFFALVQDAAHTLGCVFFLWCGEGHEFESGEMDGEDLSGWLIPEKDADEFEKLFLADDSAIWDSPDDTQVFARWVSDGENISICFERPLIKFTGDDSFVSFSGGEHE